VQVAAVEFAAVRSGKAERVRHCGITLQRLSFAQAVFEHTGYMRPLFRTWSFAFHEGSEGHDILNAPVRRSARGWQGLPLLPEFLDHGGGHVFSADMAREFVCRGKKKPLKTGSVDSDIADWRRIARGGEEFVTREEPLVRGKVRDVEHRESFGNNEILDVYAPVRDGIVDGKGGRGTVKEILAGLQGVLVQRAA